MFQLVPSNATRPVDRKSDGIVLNGVVGDGIVLNGVVGDGIVLNALPTAGIHIPNEGVSE